MGVKGIVTMSTVARAAGVVPSTVSKALRDDPSISDALKEKIQKVAKELGYRPNPLVATLMAQLHGTRRRSDPHHIAWVDLWPKGTDEALLYIILKPMLTGARQRAEELGFRIEVHRAVVNNITPVRLKQILTARAQWGVIIPPVPEASTNYDLDMRGLAGVTIGTSLHSPALHRVAANHYQGGLLAFDRLTQKGFSRIGMVSSPALNDRVDRKWLAAFLAAQFQLPKARRVPPLLATAAEQAEVARWLQRHNPEVLLIGEPEVLAWPCVAKRVDAGKLRIAWLGLLGRDGKGVWGVDYQPERLGRVAIDLVVGQIHRNERGLPDSADTVLINGVWVETGS